MKRLIVLVALLIACAANAVDVTVTLTAQEATRFQVAVGADQAFTAANGSPRAATVAEAKQDVIDYMRRKTVTYERRIEQQKISTPAFDPQ